MQLIKLATLALFAFSLYACGRTGKLYSSTNIDIEKGKQAIVEYEK